MVVDAVRAALMEDLGLAGDVTSDAIIPETAKARAVMNARDKGVISGLALAQAAFEAMDPKLKFIALVSDGDRVKAGQDVARIEGNARAILAAERVALNYICHLSGIATHTSLFAHEIAHTKAQICCTRKTIPGLRSFEKYAVKCGGGSNHRFGLDDAILIKDLKAQSGSKGSMTVNGRIGIKPQEKFPADLKVAINNFKITNGRLLNGRTDRKSVV